MCDPRPIIARFFSLVAAVVVVAPLSVTYLVGVSGLIFHDVSFVDTCPLPWNSAD